MNNILRNCRTSIRAVDQGGYRGNIWIAYCKGCELKVQGEDHSEVLREAFDPQKHLNAKERQRNKGFIPSYVDFEEYQRVQGLRGRGIQKRNKSGRYVLADI